MNMGVLKDYKCSTCGFFESQEPKCPSCGNMEVMQVFLTPPNIRTSSSPSEKFGDEFRHDFDAAAQSGSATRMHDMVEKSLLEEGIRPDTTLPNIFGQDGSKQLEQYGNVNIASMISQPQSFNNPLFNIIENRTGRNLRAEEQARLNLTDRIKRGATC